jgi:hypothetical protein
MALETGRLATNAAHRRPPIELRPVGGAKVSMLGRPHARACVFWAPHPGASCIIHRDLGHSALPLACRQFPRVVLRDDRGVFVTLSHFCPTAASLLAGASGVATVERNAPPYAGAELEGLDATGQLPPLLRPDTLTTFDAVSAWERWTVGLLTDERWPLEEALAAIVEAGEAVRAWRAGGPGLDSHVVRVLTGVRSNLSTHRSLGVFADDMTSQWVGYARDAVPRERRPGWLANPVDLRRASTPAAGDTSILRRYLAARAFGSWALYQGRGLRTWVRALALASALVRAASVGEDRQPTGPTDMVERLGAADLVLMHLVDPAALYARLSEDEPHPLG